MKNVMKKWKKQRTFKYQSAQYFEKVFDELKGVAENLINFLYHFVFLLLGIAFIPFFFIRQIWRRMTVWSNRGLKKMYKILWEREHNERGW